MYYKYLLFFLINLFYKLRYVNRFYFRKQSQLCPVSNTYSMDLHPIMLNGVYENLIKKSLQVLVFVK